MRAFRFGWYFAPDYELYRTLHQTGIRADASNKYQEQERVSIYQARYLPPVPDLPREVHGVRLFPHRNVLLIHDWNVVPHDMPWHAQGEAESEIARERLRADLRKMAETVARGEGRFATFRTAIAGLAT